MRKKLSAIGNSLGIVIEKPIELLDIDRETELDMRTGRRAAHHRACPREAHEGEDGGPARDGCARPDPPEPREVIDPVFLDVEDVLLVHEEQLAV